MIAYVRTGRGGAMVPGWQGGRMSLSTRLGEGLRGLLAQAGEGRFDEAEVAALRPLLALQERVSRLPRAGELPVECITSREGTHWFVYPFAGRLVNEGLSALVAWRLSRLQPATFISSVNDYGFDLLSPTMPALEEAPLRRTLVVADPHFGKGAVFRRAGVAVPHGSARDDPARLGEVSARCAAERLIVLGDLLHVPPRGDEPWLEAFARWRRSHAALAVEVVRGNHDRQWLNPEAWRLAWHDEALCDGVLRFAHEPEASPSHYTLAGRGDRLCLPALWLRAHSAVLPAFGSFTGGYPVRPQAGERLFIVAPDAVVVCGPR